MHDAFNGGIPAGTDDPEADLAEVRALLEPARASLTAAGFYAYGTFDDQMRWSIAVDDEIARVDVRVAEDGYLVELWATSPGLFMDEENEWRRRVLERLARRTVPAIAKGMLGPDQEAVWSEEDHGVGVRLRYRLQFRDAPLLGDFVRRHIGELDEVLTFVESQVVS